MNVYHKRRDANECEVCKAVRAIPGRVVTIQTIEGATSHGGQRLPTAGCPDVIAGFGGRDFLIEIKDLSKRTAARKSAAPLKLLRTVYAQLAKRLAEGRARLMSPVQLEWATVWAGSPVHCVTSAQEFAAVLGLCLRCGTLDDSGLCNHCEAAT